MTEELKKQFEEAAKPLIKFLAQEVHPHHTVVVSGTGAELLEGEVSVRTNEFLVD